MSIGVRVVIEDVKVKTKRALPHHVGCLACVKLPPDKSPTGAMGYYLRHGNDRPDIVAESIIGVI